MARKKRQPKQKQKAKSDYVRNLWAYLFRQILSGLVIIVLAILFIGLTLMIRTQEDRIDQLKQKLSYTCKLSNDYLEILNQIKLVTSDSALKEILNQKENELPGAMDCGK